MAERGGLPWYQQWTEFSRHGKTRDLCGRVKDRNAGMYVIRLFEHCAEYALDGRLPAHAVEEAAGWHGKDGTLLAALEAAGWLEMGADRDVRVLHGWEERNGARIREWKREKAKRKPPPNPTEDHPQNPPGFPPKTPTETPEKPRRIDPRSKKLLRDQDRFLTASQPEITKPARLAGPVAVLDQEQTPAPEPLLLLRSALAEALGKQKALGLGRDRAGVVAEFTRWIQAVGEQDTVAECVRLAAEQGAEPDNLAWWVGWLKTVPDRKLRAGGSP